MVDWLNKAIESKYTIDTGRGSLTLTEPELEKAVKDHIKNSAPLMSLFERFNISPAYLNRLHIQIKDLEGKYSETDGESMVLNTFLLDGGKFFQDYFFVVAHELVHYVTRVAEQLGRLKPTDFEEDEDAPYFHDSEERDGFMMSIAYLLDVGASRDEIWNKVFPKVSFHFNDESDAAKFFAYLYKKAKLLVVGG